MPYFVYILKSIKEDTYYVGSTQDLDSRLERHNQGRSKYTKAKRPWQLVYREKCQSRAEAMSLERKIKARKSKDYIEALVRTSRQT